MPTSMNITHLKIAYECLAESIVVVDASGNVLFFNPAFKSRYLGDIQIAEDSIDFQQLVRLQDSTDWSSLLELAAHTQWQGNVKVGLPPQNDVVAQLSIDVLEQNKQIMCYVLRFSAPKEPSIDGELLSKLAYKDSLTGLANRSLFNQLFDHEISQSQRLNMRFALLFIDLDGFKRVNDNHGHDAGDVLLLSIAQRLEKSLRKSDIVARLGGDEFVVIMNNIKDSETIAKVTEKLIREIKKPVKSGANMIEVGCSIGISVYPDNGDNAEELIQQADVAMYRAKHQHGSHYYYFSDALNRELQDSRLVEQQILAGLKTHQFVPHFQPVIDHISNKIVGIECLARWQHPQRGLLSAMEFIPVAVKMGLIQTILEQILDTAFAELKNWHERLGVIVPLSINISSKQFYQQTTFDQIAMLLDKHGLSSEAIKLEVTESTLQDSGPGLVEQMQRLSHAGFSLTLDDFGTGYSSLRYLQQLPVDTLKIDRSFVRNLENNPHDKIIVKAIIQLAQTLDIMVVAEGVENITQASYLLDNDCHIMQGFLFSPALSVEHFSEFMDKRSFI